MLTGQNNSPAPRALDFCPQLLGKRFLELLPRGVGMYISLLAQLDVSGCIQSELVMQIFSGRTGITDAVFTQLVSLSVSYLLDRAGSGLFRADVKKYFPEPFIRRFYYGRRRGYSPTSQVITGMGYRAG